MALPLNYEQRAALVDFGAFASVKQAKPLGTKLALGAVLVGVMCGALFNVLPMFGSVAYMESPPGLRPPPTPAPPLIVKIKPVKPAEPEWKQYLANRDGLKRPSKKYLHYYQSDNPVVDRKTLRNISSYYGLPPELLYYQNYMESNGQCLNAASKKGAVGCFQFLEATAKEFGLVTDSGDYRTRAAASADAAARYMLWLAIVMYGEQANLGNWEQLRHVLAAYNAGYAVVTKSGTPQIPTYVETVNYVTKIESLVKGDAIIVRRGETLEALSERAGVSIETLLRSNVSITGPKELRTGMVLLLPDSDGMSRVVVRKGMNLYSIHRRTGVPLEQLSLANGLGKNNTIQTGTVLLIPSV